MLVNSLNEIDKKQLIDYCYNRYGVKKSLWLDKEVIKTKDALWLINSSMLSFASETQVEFESMGLRCFSGKEFPYKITDGFYKTFGDAVTKGLLSLEKESARSMLKGETLSRAVWGDIAFDGYVLLFYGSTFLGIGLKKGDQVTSQIPKTLRSQLGKNLEIRDE